MLLRSELTMRGGKNSGRKLQAHWVEGSEGRVWGCQRGWKWKGGFPEEEVL